MTTEKKKIGFTRWIFVRKVMSLLFNMLSRLLIAFLPRSKHLLISWLQSVLGIPLEKVYGFITYSNVLSIDYKIKHVSADTF